MKPDSFRRIYSKNFLLNLFHLERLLKFNLMKDFKDHK